MILWKIQIFIEYFVFCILGSHNYLFKDTGGDGIISATVTPNSKQPNVQPVLLIPHTQHVRTSERTTERMCEYLHERTYSTDEETLDSNIPVRKSSMDGNEKEEKKRNGREKENENENEREREREVEKDSVGSRSENSKIKGGKPAGSDFRTTSRPGCRGDEKERSASPPKLRKSASNLDLLDSSG